MLPSALRTSFLILGHAPLNCHHLLLQKSSDCEPSVRPILGPLRNAALLMNLGGLGDETTARIVGQCNHYDSHGCPDIQVNQDLLVFRVKGTCERQQGRPTRGRI
jgi:hypothetical protein